MNRWKARGIVLILTLITYGSVLRLPFLFDDHRAIEQNATLRSWSGTSIQRDFSPHQNDPWAESYYRPLQFFSHRLDLSLWGLHPAGHHLTNLILHLLCALMVLELAGKLGLSDRAATLAATFFAVHPIIVSELMMVSGRPEVMSFFFTLCTVYLFWNADVLSIFAGSSAFLAALLSKESAIAAPFFVAVLLWHGRRYERILLKGSCLAIPLVFYVVLRHQSGSMIPDVGVGSLCPFLVGRLPMVLLRSMALMIFPWPLYLYHQMPTSSGFFALLAGGILFCAGFALRRNRLGIACFVWFLASWIAKIPLMIHGYFIFDHWLYPALPALTWFLAERITDAHWTWQQSQARVAQAVSLFLLIFWSSMAQFYIAVRNTDEKNYRWALRFTRATPLYFNLGLICLRTGRPQEALSYFEPVLALDPKDPLLIRAVELARRRAAEIPNGKPVI